MEESQNLEKLKISVLIKMTSDCHLWSTVMSLVILPAISKNHNIGFHDSTSQQRDLHPNQILQCLGRSSTWTYQLLYLQTGIPDSQTGMLGKLNKQASDSPLHEISYLEQEFQLHWNSIPVTLNPKNKVNFTSHSSNLTSSKLQRVDKLNFYAPWYY